MHSRENDRGHLASAERHWTLVAMILASGIVFLDSAVVSVAVPAIGRELGAGLAGLQWVVDGYFLTLAAFLIPGGALGDRRGRRQIMLLGLAGFGLMSTAAGLAPSVEWLTGARLLQGVSAALLVPGSLAIIRAVYTDQVERGRAIGTWSGWSGVPVIIGPLWGGWLVDNLSWRWVFFTAVPLVAITAWLLATRVPENRDLGAANRLDWAGAALAMIGLGSIAYALIQGPVVGWNSSSVVLALVVGMMALVFFPVLESRAQDPMVSLSMFRSRNFTGANLTTLGVYAALQGGTFFVVLYLQNVMGYAALAAGLVLAPIGLVLLLLSSTFGELAGRYGPRLFMTIGPMICGIGLFALTWLRPDSNIWTSLLPAMTVFSLGLACTVAPLTHTLMSAVPSGQSGVAAAFNNVVSRVAGLLAIAGFGVVLTMAFNQALTEQMEDLDLDSFSIAALEDVSRDPTEAANLEGLTPEAEAAVDEAYTEGFRWTITANAVTAAASGILAALFVRKPSSD